MVDFAEFAPGTGRQEAVVAGVAQFFNLMRPGLGFGLGVFDGSVNQQKIAAGTQHAGGFADKTFRRTEMMGGDAAGYEIELSVGVGKLFGGVLPGLDSEASFRRRPGSAIEHGLGDVREGDIKAKAGQEQAGMARASGEVERAGA